MIVPYELSEDIKSDDNTVEEIKKSIAEFRKKSCVQWVPLEDTDNQTQHHVKFVRKDGCYSELGKADWYNQGFQELSLGEGCGYMYIIIHEMLHAMGFFHEQARPDRDSYIKVSKFFVTLKHSRGCRLQKIYKILDVKNHLVNINNSQRQKSVLWTFHPIIFFFRDCFSSLEVKSTTLRSRSSCLPGTLSGFLDLPKEKVTIKNALLKWTICAWKTCSFIVSHLIQTGHKEK